MAPRTISTVLLLCASALATPAAAAPLVDEGGYPLVGNLMLKGGSTRPERPPPDDQVSKEVLALRAELAKVGLDKARTDARFRALCDDDANPVVRDAGPATHTQPSRYCAATGPGTGESQRK